MKLPEKLVFATNNAHKLQEARAIVEKLCHRVGCSCQILSLNDIGCHEDVEENADTLEGNALIKARYVASKYNCNCFADDTGLEVEALGGMPGVHTARYAALQDENSNSHDSNANMRLLLNNLAGASNRKARFRTAIALILDGKEYLYQGEVKGKIATEPKGEEGFGYDPVFIPQGYEESFGQMEASKKNSMSHRGRAIENMLKEFEN